MRNAPAWLRRIVQLLLLAILGVIAVLIMAAPLLFAILVGGSHGSH